MSVMTGVIVSIFAVYPSVEERVVGDVQNWLADHGHMPFERVGSGFGTGGGEKSLCDSLLIGTFNHFEAQVFCDWVAAQGWYDSEGEYVQVEVIVKEHDREDFARWKILPIGGER